MMGIGFRSFFFIKGALMACEKSYIMYMFFDGEYAHRFGGGARNEKECAFYREKLYN